ncbi:hypothetical protein GCWU000342_02280 [Shuttleworthella satelles DSM 14600]|uniref:Uncharacterized protein n=1 Tax=Shuttleworthella satelles DSM 14600 TaxID=626523 RepID=C4GDV6_9FIRM|nr:hypothetical protein GCWU000342_02280 [Shuttleworthia satelles DSM 14600]
MISNFKSLQLWRVFLPQLQASYKCRNHFIYDFWLIIVGIHQMAQIFSPYGELSTATKARTRSVNLLITDCATYPPMD